MDRQGHQHDERCACMPYIACPLARSLRDVALPMRHAHRLLVNLIRIICNPRGNNPSPVCICASQHHLLPTGPHSLLPCLHRSGKVLLADVPVASLQDASVSLAGHYGSPPRRKRRRCHAVRDPVQAPTQHAAVARHSGSVCSPRAECCPG